MPQKPALRALALMGLLLPAIALGGCDAIYDDTKGWANRLEASVLETAHEMGEPDSEEAADGQAMASTAAAEPAPPAVPVEPVETAQLTPPPAALPMTPDPGMAAQPPAKAMPPAKAAPAPAADGATTEAAGALMATQTPADAKSAETTEDAKAMPPHPVPKPKAPATLQAKTEAPGEHDAVDPAAAVVLHLSSLRSEAAAKREWSDLQHSFPQPLSEMPVEFRRTDLGDKGTFYRVLAGPLPSRDKARQVCAELKAKDAKQYCRILPAGAKPS